MAPAGMMGEVYPNIVNDLFIDLHLHPVFDRGR